MATTFISLTPPRKERRSHCPTGDAVIMADEMSTKKYLPKGRVDKPPAVYRRRETLSPIRGCNDDNTIND